ncbi:MAG: dUTP diphosphatase [Clostridiaceae bacterium]
MILKIKKLKGCEDLETPRYMTNGSVGMDLYAAVTEDVIVNKGKITLIPTGIAMEIPSGYEGQIRPRSGLALKHGISLVNSPGTIDWDFRGEIKIILINFGDEDFVIKRGDRIAQIIFNKVAIPCIEIVEDIDNTDRGLNGFGSTGL